MKIHRFSLFAAAALSCGGVVQSCGGSQQAKQSSDTAIEPNSGNPEVATIYDYSVVDNEGNTVSLSDYRGKVLLVVNTATRCGFTPQYTELEQLYADYRDRGLVVLDFPCNQFGNQAPGSDAEIQEFCTLNYNTEFPRFHKVDVNGENASPFFTFLKSQQGFSGFDMDHPIGPKLDEMMSKANPDYKENPDIKWNFTKFLINRDGEVVARFEPTATAEILAPAIEALL